MRIKDLSSQARSVGTDDFEDVDGATNASRKISPFDAHGQFRNALAPRGGVAFDGTASNAIWGPCQAISTDPWSASIWLQVPTTIPSQSAGLFYLGSSNSGNLSLTNCVLGFIDNSTGHLRLIHYDGSSVNVAEIQFNSFVTLFGGKCVHLCWTVASGIATLYINGVVAQTNSDADWLTNISSTYYVLGLGSSTVRTFAGRMHGFSLYNLALSASDVQEIHELGGTVPERFKFGSQAALNTSNFSDPVGNIDSFTGLSATGFTLSEIGGDTTLSRVNPAPFDSTLKRTNRSYRASWTHVKISGVDPSLTQGAGSITLLATTGSGNYSVAFTASPISAHCDFRALGNSAYVVSNFLLIQTGAVVHLPLDDGLGFQLQDVSTNRLHALMTTTGVSHVAPSYGPAPFRAQSSTNGNQQLGGQNVIPGNSRIVRLAARANGTAPTVTLGTGSGGSQVVASVALTNGAWKDLTNALTGGMVGTSDISLWAGSNNTTTVDWDIRWEPLSP